MILLVVDMQKGLVDEDLYAFDTFIDRTVRLVDAARKNNIEVIFVQHDAGPDSGMSIGDEAFEIIDRIAPAEGEKVFVKTINSCFGNKDNIIFHSFFFTVSVGIICKGHIPVIGILQRAPFIV